MDIDIQNKTQALSQLLLKCFNNGKKFLNLLFFLSIQINFFLYNKPENRGSARHTFFKGKFCFYFYLQFNVLPWNKPQVPRSGGNIKIVCPFH